MEALQIETREKSMEKAMDDGMKTFVILLRFVLI